MQVLAFLACAIAVSSRRPDALFNAQFWGEDGADWFAQAYNLGWLHALGRAGAGYLLAVPRLVASAALLVPLRLAPLLMNCVAITLQVLPVNVLLSSRCSKWGSLPIRMLYSAVYLAIPNSWEIHANITNAHSHLALVAILLATSVPAKNLKWKAFDITILLLGGLTGPWCIVLLPLVLVFWWRRRYPWSLVVAAIVGLCAAIQSFVLLTHTGPGARPVGQLGASPMLLLRLLGGHVFAGALVGHNLAVAHGRGTIIGVFVLLGGGILLYTVLKSRLEFKLFLAFCSTLLVASLSRPIMVEAPLLQWPALLNARGNRYWFFPMLAFLWSLVWCASEDQRRLVQASCAAILLTMTIGVVRDWRYAPYEDKHFQRYAEQFQAAPPGTSIVIPINPDGWSVRLT
ncbi:MAG: hypothetical protein ACJ74Y_06430, partial [Bryobacteraceae bacterium]